MSKALLETDAVAGVRRASVSEPQVRYAKTSDGISMGRAARVGEPIPRHLITTHASRVPTPNG